MQGRIPPGVAVPLPAHPDPETFIMRSGRLEGLVARGEGYRWMSVSAGEIFHVPAHAKHAWRNSSGESAVAIIVSTVKIGRFFREVGTPIAPGRTTESPPAEQAIERLIETAARYGYWNAGPEENAALGLEVG